MSWIFSSWLCRRLIYVVMPHIRSRYVQQTQLKDREPWKQHLSFVFWIIGLSTAQSSDLLINRRGLAGCLLCECNGHGNELLGTCHNTTGKCFCQDDTDGNQCEYCQHGFYGDPRSVSYRHWFARLHLKCYRFWWKVDNRLRLQWWLQQIFGSQISDNTSFVPYSLLVKDDPWVLAYYGHTMYCYHLFESKY